MDLGAIAARMTLDIANFTTQLDLAEGQATKMAQNASKSFQLGDALTSVGKTATKALTVPLLGIGLAAMKIGNDFEYQMSRVGAIAGSTESQLKKLSDQAVDLGAKTSFSASEAAAGMENLASAGFDTNEIMGAMPGVLDLAAVSGGDVALSAEAMATTLRAFSLEADDASHVADVFAKTAADTNAEASDMAEAMKYAAPVAHAMGISMEETAAAIGLMSDAGIKGSQAGTTLRGAFSRLAKPTKMMKDSMEELGVSFYDAEGNMLPLKDQMALLQDATKDLTKEERNRHLVTLYGQQSLSGMLALLDAGPEKLDAMTKGLEDADGAAEAMAAQMMDNTKMAIEEMLGAFESAAIIIQQILAPAVRKMADGIAFLVQKFVDASPLGQKLTVVFGLMVAALGPLLVIVGTAISLFVKLKIAFAIMGKSAVAMSGWIGIIVVAIYALVAVFMIAYTKSEKFRNVINSIIPVLKAGLSKALELAQLGIEKLGDAASKAGTWIRDKFGSSIDSVRSVLDRIGPSLSALGSAIGSIMSSGFQIVVDLFGRLRDVLGGALGTAIEFVSNAMDKMGGSFGKIGAVAGVVASSLVKVGLAVLGISGPWGVVISLISSFLIMWAKTGEINADGITQVFENITNAISGAADMITEYLPKFIEIGMNVLLKLIDGITAALPGITDTMVTVTTFLITALAEALPLLLESGLNIILKLIEGITTALPQVIDMAISILEFLITSIVGALPLIIDVGITLITTLLEGIMNALPELLAAGLLILTALVEIIISLLPMLLDVGITILTALIGGIVEALPQLIESGLAIITALIEAIITLLPALLEAGIQILMALIEGIISIIPALLDAAIQIVTALIEAFIQFLPALLAAGMQLIMALVQGLIKILPSLISAAITLIGGLLKAVIAFLPQLLSSGAELIGALVRGVLSLLGALISAAVQLGTSLVSSIIDFAGGLLSAGIELITNFISGIGQKISDTIAKGTEVGQSVVTSVSDFVGDMRDAAVNLVEGFIGGIGSMIQGVKDKAAEMASSAVDTVKGWLKIKSPSRVMFGLGGNTGQGFINGIASMVNGAANISEKMARVVSDKISDVKVKLHEDEMVNSVKNAMSKVHDLVSENISLPELAIATEAANSIGRNYQDVTSFTPEPEKPQPTRFEEDDDPKGNVYIDTIVVRNDDDLDTLTDGLYNKSKEKLSSLGNTKR